MRNESEDFYALVGKANEEIDGLLARLPPAQKEAVVLKIAETDPRSMRSSGKAALKYATTTLDETTRIVDRRLRTIG
jgi:hypothetical protein